MDRGTLIAGRYVLEGLAGSGGVGSVYRARDLNSGATVAIKVLKLHRGQLDRRLARETKVLRQLHHPAIVRFLDSGFMPGRRRYLVMEWLDGADLAGRLRDEPLSVAESLTLIDRIAAALALAHSRGVVHRDVKPGNLFLPGGRARAAKLLDFGVARWADATDEYTDPGDRPGTPLYMSPEQLEGEPELTPQADVFSLGCVLFECLTGQPAFWADNRRDLLDNILVHESPDVRDAEPAVPEPIAALVRDMLRKDESERPSSAEVGEAACALLRALPDHAARFRPPPARRPARRPEARVVSAVVARGEQPPPDVPVLARSVAPLGARLIALGERLLVAHLEGRAPSGPDTTSQAVDHAHNAARCALLLGRSWPGATLAVASDRAAPGSAVADRALAMLDDMARTAAGAIRVDAQIARQVRARFDVTGSLERGFRLYGERTPATPGPPPASAPFFSRVGELATLVQIVDQCLADRCARVVVVTGQPGFGKTQLCRELLSRVTGRELGLWLVPAAGVTAEPLLPSLARAVRAATGLSDEPESRPDAERREAVRRYVGAFVSGPDADATAALVAELCGVAPTAPDHDRLATARGEPGRLRRELGRAVLELLRGELRVRPVLLVIDDLQWADRASLELIDRALAELADQPLGVIGFGRPDVGEVFPGLWADHGSVEIRLGPLVPSVARAWVQSELGDDIAAERADELVQRARGNPFYLEELVRSVADKDAPGR